WLRVVEARADKADANELASLLRVRRQRPYRCTAEERNELPPLHRANPKPNDYGEYSRSGACIAAKAGRPFPLWVNRFTSTSRGRPRNVRFTPNRWGNRPTSLWIAEEFGCCASG